MPSITLEDVEFSYPRKLGVIRNLSATLSAPPGSGRLVAIMGPSGCGKSTLLRLIAGAEVPQRGRIETEPEGCLVSYLAQEPILLEHLSKADSVSVFGRLSSCRRMFDAGLLQHLLEELEIADKIRDSTRLVDMSGGEKQRLCLARSLSVRPSILLLDEPCTGLDPFKKLSFLKKLRTLVDEYQILAVYVTHHANEVRLICDDVALMRSCPDGTTEISRQRVSEFLQKPPSPEATQILLPELLNQLFCIRRRECFYLVGSDEMVAQASERAGDDTTCTVLFDPTALLASRDGFRCEIVSASDVFRFVKPVAQPQSLLVSAGAVGTDRAMVRGTALVFPDNSRFGYRTELI